jgi:hypothetical protein
MVESILSNEGLWKDVLDQLVVLLLLSRKYQEQEQNTKTSLPLWNRKTEDAANICRLAHHINKSNPEA